jgi:hypothetical protein
MAHTHSTQRFYTGNPQPGKPFLYSLYRISPFTINIYNFFRYFVDTKTLIPKTGIIFSKPLKIEKSAKNRKKNAQKQISGRCPRLHPVRTLCVTKGGHTCPPPRTPLGKRSHAQDTNKALL